MNNEIKEILEQLEWYKKIGKKDVYYPECVLPNKKAFILLDYITNLQEELHEIIDNADWWHNRFKEVQRENERLKTQLFKSVNNTNNSMELTEDYKSRCEKANELLKYYDPEPWSTYQITGETLLNLLNILQGENNGN